MFVHRNATKLKLGPGEVLPIQFQGPYITQELSCVRGSKNRQSQSQEEFAHDKMQELLGDVEAEILRAEERLRRSVWPLSEEKQSAGAGDYHASGVTITSSRSRIYAPQSEVPERLACAEDREGFLSQILSRERQPMVDTHTCLYGEAQPGPARVPPGPSATTSGTTSSVAAPPPPVLLASSYCC